MKSRSRVRGWLPSLLTLAVTACSSGLVDKNLDAVLEAEGVDPERAALLIVRLEDGQRWSSGGDRLDERFSPASTSKIPHTLIAFETDAVSGPDEIFEWDGEARFSPGWNGTQNFRTAFKRSTVWIYQTITARIGSDVLADWLGKFEYGNADTGGPERVTEYWLTGPLAISAQEQVAFLGRLARRDLPLSAETYAAALPIMVEEATKTTTLYAKTGWKHVPGETDIGWYVGWLEQASGAAAGTYVFAFNMDMPDPETQRHSRRNTVYRALETIGAK